MSEAETPAPSPGGGGQNGMMMAIVVAVLMLGGGFALTYFVLPDRLAAALAKQMPSDDGTGAPPATAAAAAPAEGEKKTGEGGKAEGGAKDFVLTDLLINVAKTNGTRFVKTTVFFDADPAVIKDLDDKRAKITDIVQQTIASKTMDELTAPDSRGKLRSELLATINPLLDAKGEVNNIYFQEFIIQ